MASASDTKWLQLHCFLPWLWLHKLFLYICTRLAECWWRGKKQNKTKQNKTKVLSVCFERKNFTRIVQKFYRNQFNFTEKTQEEEFFSRIPNMP
jgi:hypothetical protein